jgi:hypothetical protein
MAVRIQRVRGWTGQGSMVPLPTRWSFGALPLGGSMTLLSGWVKARTRLRSAASRREHNLKCLFSAGCADSTEFALEGCATSATTPGFSMEHLSCAAAGTVDNV